jgi:hypothetical protein
VSAARAVTWQRRTATPPNQSHRVSWFGWTTSRRCRQSLACGGGSTAFPRYITGAGQTMKQSDGLCKQWLAEQGVGVKQP